MFRKRGFTLIELVLVIVILGILAVVALPRYFGLLDDAKKASLRGTLGNVRSAITIAHARWLAAGASGATTIDGLTYNASGYPLIGEVQDNATNDGSEIMEDGDLPDNPFSTGTNKDYVAAGTKPTAAPGTNTGAWIYNATTGGFYANTDPGWDF